MHFRGRNSSQAQGFAILQPLYAATDPFLNAFRGLGLTFGGIDLSPLPAFFLLSWSQNALATLGCDSAPSLARRHGGLGQAQLKTRQVMQHAIGKGTTTIKSGLAAFRG